MKRPPENHRTTGSGPRAQWLPLLGALAAFACAGTNRAAPPAPASPAAASASPAVAVSAPSAAPPTGGLEVDVSALAPQLAALPAQERAEQIADWAVEFALAGESLSAKDLLASLGSLLPLRSARLEVLVPFDYGRGRYAVLPDGRVWLFISAEDPHPRVTVAQLADRARVALGEIPASFEILRFSLADGERTLLVEPMSRVQGTGLFSSAFGYVETPVQNPRQLEQWLAATDQLTYFESTDAGSVRLGGRRFAEAPTPQLPLADIATLHQAHGQGTPGVQPLLRAQRTSRGLVDAFTELQAAYNADVVKANASQSIDCARFESALRNLRGLAKQLKLPPQPECRQASPETVMQAHLATVDQAARDVQAELNTLDAKQQQIVQQASRQGSPLPGFSLDPLWKVDGLVRDLETLRSRPIDLARRAHRLAATASGSTSVTSASLPVLRARRLHNLLVEFGSDDIGPLSESVRSGIEAAIAQARAAGTPTIEDLVAFERLRAALASARGNQAVLLHAMLSFIESQNRVQCARYDGGLQGTPAAMNLFYTDLLGKLWAGLDYRGSAPRQAIPGFSTLMQAHDDRGGEDSTRIWFGGRADRISRSADLHVVRFAPVITRVYSAGSSSLNPGAESVPRDSVRQVLDFWTNHYGQVAALEPQYYVQNELHKWSALTSLLVQQDTLAELSKLPTDRKQRFDHWAAANARKSMPGDFALLPPERGLPTNPSIECMDLLASEGGTREAGFVIYGGVTLAATDTLEKASVIDTKIPVASRREGLDYAKSSPDHLRLETRGISVRMKASPGHQAAAVIQLDADRLGTGSRAHRDMATTLDQDPNKTALSYVTDDQGGRQSGKLTLTQIGRLERRSAPVAMAFVDPGQLAQQLAVPATSPRFHREQQALAAKDQTARHQQPAAASQMYRPQDRGVGAGDGDHAGPRASEVPKNEQWRKAVARFGPIPDSELRVMRRLLPE